MVLGLAGRAMRREPLDHLISVVAVRATEKGVQIFGVEDALGNQLGEDHQ